MESMWRPPQSVLAPITVTVTGTGKGSRSCAGLSPEERPKGLRGRGAELRWARGRRWGPSGQRLWAQKGEPALESGSKPSDRHTAFPPLLSNHVNSEGAHGDPGMIRVIVTAASLDSQE